MAERFSDRHGLRPRDPPPIYRTEIPVAAREKILHAVLRRTRLGLRSLLQIICDVRSVFPTEEDSLEQTQRQFAEAEWYEIFDALEEGYQRLRREDNNTIVGVRFDELGRPQPVSATEHSDQYESAINTTLRAEGIAWTMHEGRFELRSTDAQDELVAEATQALKEAGFPRAASELREAIRDLSRRPEPDVTGAIHHAQAALEAVAAEVTQMRGATLGEILNAKGRLLPKPLDEAAKKMWGYASNYGRHANELRNPTLAEAQLVVGFSATLATYLLTEAERR